MSKLLSTNAKQKMFTVTMANTSLPITRKKKTPKDKNQFNRCEIDLLSAYDTAVIFSS